MLTRLGGIYLNQRRNDRAVLVFTRLTQLAPDSAAAFQLLGRAEEARLGYAAANRAYASAAQLAPGNQDYSRHYASFKDRVAQNATAR